MRDIYANMEKELAKFSIDLGNGGHKQLHQGLELCAQACCNNNKVTMGRDIEWLSFRNGIDINVYTLEQRRRTRAHHQVYACNIDWNPSVDPQLLEEIRQLFKTMAGGRTEMIRHLLLQGYIILTGVNHKLIFINLGQTSNGKSTLMDLYEAILGALSIHGAKATFCQSRTSASSHTGFLGQLNFKRLILLDDQFKTTDKMDLALFKRLTTPRNVELVRDPYARETFNMTLDSTGGPLSQPRRYSSELEYYY